MKIEYPTNEEISAQKEKILRAIQKKKVVHRPTLRIIFYNSQSVILVGLLIYVLLLGICCSIRGTGNERYAVLAFYPLTYFSFYFLSVFSEEQSELIELKQSMKYSFTYLISMRMLYTNIVSVFLNLAMIGILHTQLQSAWNLAAAGTTTNILLALTSLILYEKTASAKPAGILLTVWIILCLLLLRYGNGFYHLLIEVIPLAVHCLISAISFFALLQYMRKVERKNAYNF